MADPFYTPSTPPSNSFKRFRAAVENDPQYNIRYTEKADAHEELHDDVHDEIRRLSREFLVTYHMVRDRLEHLGQSVGQLAQTNREVLAELRTDRDKRRAVRAPPPPFIVGLISTVCFVTPISVLLIELAKS